MPVSDSFGSWRFRSVYYQRQGNVGRYAGPGRGHSERVSASRCSCHGRRRKGSAAAAAARGPERHKQQRGAEWHPEKRAFRQS